MKQLRILILLTSILSLGFISACNKDDATGQMNVEMTDAPSDDPNVKGVIVTVIDVKVDGNSLEGFEKQTFDIMAYQHGKTKTVYGGEAEAGTYNEIELVLDYSEDASGSSPGCYVLTSKNEKVELSNSFTGRGSFKSESNGAIIADGNSNLVIDFDLRKAIKRDESEDSYELIASGESDVAVRAVQKENAGSIEGSLDTADTPAGGCVVYAYEKGSYNDGEINEDNGLRFRNAISSSMANENGEYNISFLEEGEYELHVASFKDSNGDGQSEFSGMLKIESSLGVDLSSVNVSAESKTTLNLTIMGWL